MDAGSGKIELLAPFSCKALYPDSFGPKFSFGLHEPTVGIGHDTLFGTHRALVPEPQTEMEVK